MTDRVIHCSDYELGLASLPSKWLQANEVDPRLVPFDSTVTVAGGQLTYESFIPADYQPACGAGVLIKRGPDGSPAPRQLHTVPLISPPEAHGL